MQEQVAAREETSEPRYKMKIEKDVDIPMRDGAKLKADVFRPDGDGHFPVLINMGIYQKDKLWIPPPDLEEKPNPHMNWETVNPEWWVPRGYCCVRVDERGSGKSPGQSVLYSPQEAIDFYDDLAHVYREEIRDLAAAGCRYLQIDEVNLAYLCDAELRKQVANIGEDPITLPRTYAKLLNAAIKDRPRDMTVCMHLCRGNFSGAWVADGGYEPIAELIFNEINMDGYFLEYDSARAGGFEPLRFLPRGKAAVLGLVTTKSAKLESKDELKHRIDEASKHAPLEQLALSPQCGFSSGIGGNTMDEEGELAKLRLVVETAREVWGSA